MANLTPKKIDLSQINGGVEYTVNDGIQPSTINGVVGASAYAQALATNTPDTTYADLVGVPSVEIKEKADGTPQLVFKNLKGNSGAVDGVFSNTLGESTTDGYSQAVVNKLFSNPNLLINGDFSINQRGIYATTNGTYSFDRWRMNGGTSLTKGEGYVEFTSNNSWQGFIQPIENIGSLAGQTVTFSVKASLQSSASIISMGIRILKSGSSSPTVIEPQIYPSLTSTPSVVSTTVTLPSDLTNNDIIMPWIWSRNANQTIRLYWAKLEIGSIATPFSPRPYAEELAMCQRYYQKFTKSFYDTNYLYSTNARMLFTVPLMAKMRTNATVNATGSLYIIEDESANDYRLLPTFEYVSQTERDLVIKGTGTTATVGKVYPVEGTLTITADAEIY